jgi:oligopeptide transport system substrate-binding protein
MKIKNKYFIFFLITVLLMGFSLSCEKDNTPGKNKKNDMESHRKNPPYLRLPMEGVTPTIDPGLTEETGSIEVVEQLFLGLTDLNPETYEAVPELAVSWTVSDDCKIYQFKLRTDVSWTNGEPVTAHDIVWAIQRNILPSTKSPYAYSLYLLKNAEPINKGKIEDVSQLGVKAIDDYTVEFNLENPAAFFPMLAGTWVYRPLHRETLQKYKEKWTRPENIQTNGSYMLSSWNKGKLMTLKKNKKYFDAENVNISEVRYYVIPESSIGLMMYQHNDLDIMGGGYLRLPLSEILKIKANPLYKIEYANEPQFCTYFYGFNTKLPPVDNPLVRKAISAAIDRELIIDIVTKGDQQAATTFTRPPIFGSVSPEEKVGVSFNPSQAKVWLAEAGYPDGKGFPVINLMYNTSETHKEIADAVKTLLKHYLNIDIQLLNKDWETFMAMTKQPDTPHIFRFGWCADYPDANNWLYEVFHPSHSTDRIGWQNKKFASLVEAAQRKNNLRERKELYKRAEEILTQEEVGIMPMYFYTAQYLVKPRLKDWYHMAMGGQHIRNWSFDDGKASTSIRFSEK